MIEQFFRPDSVEQALELKRRYQDEAVWFAGGSKLNATPTLSLIHIFMLTNPGNDIALFHQIA